MKLTTKHNHIIDFDYLPKNPIVVDAGSKDGSIIKYFNKCEPYIIEADPQHITKLKQYFPFVYNYALVGDNSPDKIKFYSYGNVGWGSIYWAERRHKSWPLSNEYFADTIKINDLLSFLNIDHIDYLKLDIEGAEFDVFSTMGYETASKINQISCEVHEEFKENGKEMIMDRLRHLEFKDIKMYDSEEVWCRR